MKIYLVERGCRGRFSLFRAEPLPFELSRFEPLFQVISVYLYFWGNPKLFTWLQSNPVGANFGSIEAFSSGYLSQTGLVTLRHRFDQRYWFVSDFVDLDYSLYFSKT